MNLLTAASLLALAKSIYYFNLKTFSSQVHVFVTSVSDVSLNLISICLCFLPCSRIWTSWIGHYSSNHALTNICFSYKKYGCFYVYLPFNLHFSVCRYSLRSQANCMALTRTTSANSQHNKQTLTWGFNSLKLLHENYTAHICNSCIVFHFCFTNYFLPMFKAFCHFYDIFFILVISTSVF